MPKPKQKQNQTPSPSIPTFDKSTFDRAKLLLTIKRKHNIDADEIKAILGTDDEDLHNYYYGTLRASLSTGEESEGDKDTYKLTEKNALDLKQLDTKERRRKAAQAKAAKQAAAPVPPTNYAPLPNQISAAKGGKLSSKQLTAPANEEAQRAAFEEAGEHLEPGEKVSWDEAKKAMREVNRLFKKK